MRVPRIRRPLWALAFSAALAGTACEEHPTRPPAPGEVRGRYIRLDGSPVTGVPIRIGNQQTVTGHDGSFVFTGVDAPYDLVVGHPVGETMYEGVTRNDPIVTDPDALFGYSHRAILNSQVPPELQTLVFVTGAYPYAPWTYADPETGAVRMEVIWDGTDDSRSTKLYALRRRDGAVVDLAVRALRLNDGEERAVVLRAFDFAPVPSFAVTGSVRMPSSTQSHVIRISMSVSGTSMLLDARKGTGSATTFAFTAPVIAGAVFDVDASTVRAGYSGYSYSQITQIPPHTGPLELRLYNPPALLDPPDAAVLEASTAAFSWDVGEGPGMYEFVLAGGRRRVLYTRRTHLDMADTPALASALRPGHGYVWSLHKVHAASTADELLTIENRAALAHSSTTARRFIFR